MSVIYTATQVTGSLLRAAVDKEILDSEHHLKTHIKACIEWMFKEISKIWLFEMFMFPVDESSQDFPGFYNIVKAPFFFAEVTERMMSSFGYQLPLDLMRDVVEILEQLKTYGETRSDDNYLRHYLIQAQVQLEKIGDLALDLFGEDIWLLDSGLNDSGFLSKAESKLVRSTQPIERDTNLMITLTMERLLSTVESGLATSPCSPQSDSSESHQSPQKHQNNFIDVQKPAFATPSRQLPLNHPLQTDMIFSSPPPQNPLPHHYNHITSGSSRVSQSPHGHGQHTQIHRLPSRGDAIDVSHALRRGIPSHT